MKRGLLLYLLMMLMALSPCGVQAQQAEYNIGNSWVYPNAQKYIGTDFVNTPTGSFMNDGLIWYLRNFENNGAVNCINPLNSTLNQFIGTAQQHIKGTGTTRFYNVLFRNQLITDAFRLEQDVVVAHQADFANGIVTAVQSSPESMTNMLIMESGSTCVHTSNTSYVDGFVRKIGNSAFTFPVGDGGFYRFAAISAPSRATDHFTARYVFANPDLSGYTRTSKESSVSKVSNKEYWIVNRTNGTSNVQLTLSWDVSKTSAAVSVDLNKIQIVRWDGSKWINEGNGVITGDVSKGTITSNITGYGVFTLATANQIPVAVDDILIIAENSGVATGNVLTNDTDADVDSLVVTQYAINGVKYPAGNATVITGVGTITVNANGNYSFTPAVNYTGKVPAISYTVSDGNGGMALGNLLITVTLGNSAPVVTAKPVTTPVNIPVNGAVTATDADGDALTFTKTNDPAHGTVIVNIDGTYTYAPALNYVGIDSFKLTVSDGHGGTVTVMVTVTVEKTTNHLPVAVDDILIVAENSGVATGNVLTNDNDDDGDPLVITQYVINGVKYSAGIATVISGVGTIAVDANGSYSFTPAASYSGKVPDLTYTVSDGNAGMAMGNLLITVTLGNNYPVVTANPVTTQENVTVSGAVIATDADDDALIFTKTNDPVHGTVIINLDGTYKYIPGLNYVGVDNFRMTVSDGRGGIVEVTVTITVEEASDFKVFVPNGFSPNGDGIHDYFSITFLDRYENPVIEIYNRLGNLVYKKEHYGDLSFWGSEVEALWDGKSNQSSSSSKVVLPSGTYYYALKLDDKLKTGFVFISK